MNQIDDLTDYQSLALAGVVQAAELVHAAAHGRQQDPAAAEAVKRAITSQHAGSLREIFPEIGSFRTGARSAAQSLEGNPARQIGWMCECGERLADNFDCPACGKQFRKKKNGLVSVMFENMHFISTDYIAPANAR